MKSVMLSIQPKWCDLIAAGEKTIEVRKTRPNLEVPFKVYIYCTQDKKVVFTNHNNWRGNGMVIGEFVCDTFVVDKTYGHNPLFRAAACMSQVEAASYCLNAMMYGWHISDLVIYDTPKELVEFWKAGKCPFANGSRCTYEFHCFRAGQIDRCGESLTRPPQSWCYVEEM